MHIRRGDYLTLTSASNYHGNLDNSYYQQAFKLIHQKDDTVKIIIFSDDIEWCRCNFHGLKNIHFSPSPADAKSWEDMILMSLCRGIIIANSSYSWWSAWLGDMRYGIANRQVIAPKQWFRNKNICSSDRFPIHWTLI